MGFIEGCPRFKVLCEKITSGSRDRGRKEGGKDRSATALLLHVLLVTAQTKCAALVGEEKLQPPLEY